MNKSKQARSSHLWQGSWDILGSTQQTSCLGRKGKLYSVEISGCTSGGGRQLPGLEFASATPQLCDSGVGLLWPQTGKLSLTIHGAVLGLRYLLIIFVGTL